MNANEPAFPLPNGSEYVRGNVGTPMEYGSVVNVCAGGLTKREWLAGMAMQGILACPMEKLTAAQAAYKAIDYADALLAALAAKDGA